MSRRNDVVFGNAVLWAQDPMKKFKGGMRIKNGKIQEIFEGDDSNRELSEDMGGMHIIPGLVDAHRHFFVSALLPLFGDASVWASKNDALSAVEAACREGWSEDKWICFAGLDNAKWKNPTLPDLKDIDAVSLGLPVLIIESTLHKGLVSSQALSRAGVNIGFLRWPSDVDISRDGTPRGTIWEDVLGKVLFAMCRQMFRAMSDKDKRKIVLDEADRCLKMGLTRVHDPGLPLDIQRILADAQKHTPLKISWCITGNGSLFEAPGIKDEIDALHSEHAPRSAKFFLDGANRTAADMPVIAGLKAALKAARTSLSEKSLLPFNVLLEQKTVLKNGKIYLPYLRYRDDEELIRRASFFAEKGYRLVMHALGNVAATQAARAVKALGAGDVSSVEHMLVMAEKDMDIFETCGAVASIQPGFIPFYSDTIERMGIVTYLKTFPLKSLMSRGVPVCISSDGPCGEDDPLHNIRRAVDRKKIDGSMLDPDERISEFDALSAGTAGGGRSLGVRIDGLTEGAPATFCVVDGDPFSDASRVVQTWIDGKRAF